MAEANNPPNEDQNEANGPDEAALNQEQTNIFNTIKTAIDSHGSEMFCIKGPAGTGKSHLLKAIREYAKSKEKTVITCSSTAISATEIHGRTAHSLFQLDWVSVPTESNISARKPPPEIQSANLLLWDDVQMTKKEELKAVDKKMRELAGSQDTPFGGRFVVVFAMDESGIYPPEGQPSLSWILGHDQIQTLTLENNMRIDEDDFANDLLAIGCEVNPQEVYETCVQKQMVVRSKDELIENTFSGCFVLEALKQDQKCENIYRRVIFTLEISTMLELNDYILHKYFLTGIKEFEASKPKSPEDVNLMTFDSPPHILRLAKGAQIVLLSSFTGGHDRLTRGTLLEIVKILDHTLKCKVLNGPYKDQERLIKKRKKEYHHKGLRKNFTREQFPVRLAYASTIHPGAQGRNLRKVGLYLLQKDMLPGSLLAKHGVFYTSLSRVKVRENVKVFLASEQQQNLQLDKTDDSKEILGRKSEAA